MYLIHEIMLYYVTESCILPARYVIYFHIMFHLCSTVKVSNKVVWLFCVKMQAVHFFIVMNDRNVKF